MGFYICAFIPGGLALCICLGTSFSQTHVLALLLKSVHLQQLSPAILVSAPLFPNSPGESSQHAPLSPHSSATHCRLKAPQSSLRKVPAKPLVPSPKPSSLSPTSSNWLPWSSPSQGSSAAIRASSFGICMVWRFLTSSSSDHSLSSEERKAPRSSAFYRPMQPLVRLKAIFTVLPTSSQTGSRDPSHISAFFHLISSSFPWPEFSPGSCLICLPYTPSSDPHCRLKAPQSPALFYRTSNSYVCLKAMYPPSSLTGCRVKAKLALEAGRKLSIASHRYCGWGQGVCQLQPCNRPHSYHLHHRKGTTGYKACHSSHLCSCTVSADKSDCQ
jgi:hypothetical protein